MKLSSSWNKVSLSDFSWHHQYANEPCEEYGWLFFTHSTTMSALWTETLALHHTHTSFLSMNASVFLWIRCGSGYPTSHSAQHQMKRPGRAQTEFLCKSWPFGALLVVMWRSGAQGEMDSLMFVLNTHCICFEIRWTWTPAHTHTHTHWTRVSVWTHTCTSESAQTGCSGNQWSLPWYFWRSSFFTATLPKDTLQISSSHDLRRTLILKHSSNYPEHPSICLAMS